MMGTTTIALFLACASFLVYEYVTVPRNVARDLKSLAAVTGNNVAAALVFQDRKMAAEALAAFTVTPNVVWGVVCRSDGDGFASYDRDGRGNFPSGCARRGDEVRTYDDRVELSQTIRFRGEVVGSVTLNADLREISERMWSYGQIVFIVLVLSLGVAYVIARQLQRFVSKPLVDLASVAKQVSRSKTYSVRATKAASDEIGELVDGFNTMLGQIEARDAVLEQKVYDLQREVTERQRAEAELAKQTVELPRSNNDLQQFAYVASHDLQEPLRMVSSYTQLLSKRYKDKLDGDALEFIDFAVDGVKRMQTLIKDLLEYSRVGTRGKEMVPVDATALVNVACRSLSASIKDANANVAVAALPVVMGDETQLAQLFQNLIGNAIKYRKKDVRPVVQVSGWLDQGQCHFSVKDNGIGIAPEHAEKVFVLFQRLHGKSEYEGTGIGLAICKKIVERHGGRIWIESMPGQGTDFRFTLPLASAEKSVAEACL